MIQFPKRLYFAIEAVLYIAYNAGTEPVSSREIAARQGLKPRHLEQMMQRLVRTGVLRGVRGPRGGYLLAREKRRITLADICTSLSEDESMPSTTPLGSQVVVPFVRKCQGAMAEHLQGVTIADLYEQANQRHIRKSAGAKSDFAI